MRCYVMLYEYDRAIIFADNLDEFVEVFYKRFGYTKEKYPYVLIPPDERGNNGNISIWNKNMGRVGDYGFRENGVDFEDRGEVEKGKYFEVF